jgi:hypothetical protein
MTEKPITQTTTPDWQRYLRNGGISCPYCGSEQLDGSSWESTDGVVHRKVSCTCGHSWFDNYVLSSVSHDEGKGYTDITEGQAHELDPGQICIISGLPTDCYDNGIRYGKYPAELSEREIQIEVAREMELIREIDEDDDEEFWNPDVEHLSAFLQRQHDMGFVGFAVFPDFGYGFTGDAQTA